MIGVFDSGYGGLTILRAIRKHLPEYRYIYLGDNAHAPYGPKTDDGIFELTKQGVEALFKKGCSLVILGCNTASASALRKLQQEWIPRMHPDKKILGIIVPTAEVVCKQGFKTIGILATQHTVNTGVYEKEIHKRNPEITIVNQACSNLAGMIEQYGADDKRLEGEVEKCMRGFTLLARRSPKGEVGSLDAVLLACTHYELIAEKIQQLLPKNTILVRQPQIVAQSLEDYLKRHPELEEKLDKSEPCQYFTTGNSEEVSQKSSALMAEEIQFTSL